MDVGETNVLPGFAYSVLEQFQNGETFNMVYAQKRSDREIRLRMEHFEICKASTHKMTKEQKLDHRRKRKELKEKMNEEDKKRIHLITTQVV